MKTHQPMVWLALLAILLSARLAAAEEVAVVKDAKVNVRGQPSLVGEVITQLQKGERVVVLDEINVAKPKTNEPPRWARIQMPPNTPVWVYAPYIDTNKTVKVSRLNLRAGPGENYSVVGRLQRGAAVNEIRRVEQWMEIETPPGAYAFVAANLLTKGVAEPAPAPAVPQSPIKAPEHTAIPAPLPPTEPVTSKPELAEERSAAGQEKEKPAPVLPSTPVPPPPTLTPTPDASTERPAETQVTPKLAPAPAPPLQPAEAVTAATGTTLVRAPAHEVQVRRVVRHEGIVRSTVSIQAPTYFELLSPENHKTINYLHVDKLGLKLNDYRGRRVIVTGEEAIDPRWPKTPVIEVETLELIP